MMAGEDEVTTCGGSGMPIWPTSGDDSRYDDMTSCCVCVSTSRLLAPHPAACDVSHPAHDHNCSIPCTT